MEDNKELTPRQRASRENGAKSRGPKTPEGKAKASRNACKTGLFESYAVSLESELPKIVGKRFEFLIEMHSPRNDFERGVIWDFACAKWRFERAQSMETHFVNRHIPFVRRELAAAGDSANSAQITVLAFERAFRESKFFANLGLYETRLRLGAEKAGRRLNEMLASRDKPDKDLCPAPAPIAREKQPEEQAKEPEPAQEIRKNEPTKPALILPPNPRNKPCPCGSGRKYKRCCALNPSLRRETPPDVRGEPQPKAA